MSERYKIGDELTVDGDAYELSRYDLALTNAAYAARVAAGKGLKV